MGLLEEFSDPTVHWSLGTAALVGLAASQFSGVGVIAALPIAAISITLTAFGASALRAPDTIHRKRRFCDILDFSKMWIEVLEMLAAAATCARMASATVDYISNERLREWFLGIESHSLGEPWPDVLGVSIIIVVTALFMLGLEKSSSFSALLLGGLATTFLFFVIVGSTHTNIKLLKWCEDLKNHSFQSILTAAAMCSYGFANTFPKFETFRKLKITITIFMPLFLYTTTVLVFTLMSHYKELAGTTTPLLRVFEIRDVDLARLIMAICVIFVVCLVLTEILPHLFGLFITLSSSQWQIFLYSLQYRNSLTGAPILAIFAAGSLAAILAFACPFNYMLQIMNSSTLIKCAIQSIRVVYNRYRPEFNNDSCLVVNCTTTQYSKLKTSKTSKESAFGYFSSCWKYSNGSRVNKGKNKTKPGATEDNEYLLLNDYCDKSIDLALIDESSDESDDGKGSILSLSSDVDDSYSSTDIDAVVQEYKDRVQVATIDNFNESRHPTQISTITVMMFLFIVVLVAICATQVIVYKYYQLLWLCLLAVIFSMMVILLMPANTIKSDGEILAQPLTSVCAILALVLNTILAYMVIGEVWPGLIFWFCAGGLLFWRCDCCTCDDLINQRKLNITENVPEYPDRLVDTILIAR